MSQRFDRMFRGGDLRFGRLHRAEPLLGISL